MKTSSFKDYLISNLNVDEDKIDSLIDSCSVKAVKKDHFLLRANEHCNYTFFVESGLLRQYSVDEKGKEHILTFAPENWFVADRESIHFNRPSKYYIQALEDSQIVLLDSNFLQKLTDSLPEFSDFNLRLLHNHIHHLHKRIDLLLSASAKDRYLQFIKMYPDILLRVPQSMIASYLGIAPESLSRVRRELVQ